MAADATKETEFEIGHVLFIDIVGYSKLLNEEQKERLNQLTEISSPECRESTELFQRVRFSAFQLFFGA